jgi:hypothetical protein
MTKSYYSSVLIIAVLALSGCTTTSKNLIRTYTPTYHAPAISEFPSLGEVKTVEVGESLVSKEQQTTVPSIDLEQVIEHSVNNLGRTAVVTALPGRYVERGKDPFGKYYEAAPGKMLENGKPMARFGIYVTDSDPQLTEIYALSSSSAPLSYPRPGIPFKKSSHHTRDELSFRRELVYTGVSQTVVSIMYREFKDDTARPAFSQDLKYDLAESKIVGYRGARFEIIRATNQGLTYKTLKQLD